MLVLSQTLGGDLPSASVTPGCLLPTIRNDMVHESDRIRDAQFENYIRIREAAETEINAENLEKFLNISKDKAREIAKTDYLFAD